MVGSLKKGWAIQLHDVCVGTICTDVKLPCLVDGCFSCFFYFALQLQGAQKAHRAVPNEALYGVLSIQADHLDVPALVLKHLTVMGRG